MYFHDILSCAIRRICLKNLWNIRPASWSPAVSITSFFLFSFSVSETDWCNSTNSVQHTERKLLRDGDFSDKTFIKQRDRRKLNPLVAGVAHAVVCINALHYLTYLLKIILTWCRSPSPNTFRRKKTKLSESSNGIVLAKQSRTNVLAYHSHTVEFELLVGRFSVSSLSWWLFTL